MGLMTAVAHPGRWARAQIGWFRAEMAVALPADRRPRVPWIALLLAASVLLTALVTGVFTHELSARVAGWGSFGFPSLRAGRWWTVFTSLVLTRDWFMASTMPICIGLALGAYERRAGHARAFVVAGIGHVTGSVVVAVASGILAWSGLPILVRAGQNLDYGGSMVIAAALGALASRLRNRRIVVLAFGIAVASLILHHQMADWGHAVALPAGFAADRVRRVRIAMPSFAAVAAATVALTWWGPAAVRFTAETIRFDGRTSAPAQRLGSAQSAVAVPQGQWSNLVYDAAKLGHRPEVARVFVPAPSSTALPVLVFLCGVPGAAEDWQIGGGIGPILSDEVAAHRFPHVIAVFPDFDGYHDPAAGWADVPGQPTLTSIKADLLPALAEHVRVRSDRHALAVIGVGHGADGALHLATSDPNVSLAVALEPHDPAAAGLLPATARAYVQSRPSTAGSSMAADHRWARWRSELPAGLRWLETHGFGTGTGQGPAPVLRNVGVHRL
ncbi:MAG: xynZ [Actinomycetia bacterium]|nr:xynZ [Actinomycetes bacterium]